VKNEFNIGNAVTCVIPVIYRDPIQMINMHDHLLKHGFFASAVMAPACALDAPRFRITATATQTREYIDTVVQALIAARSECDETTKIKEFFGGK
jgi:7-keto-8-aminopelargonate synthetase-like enzyme